MTDFTVFGTATPTFDTTSSNVYNYGMEFYVTQTVWATSIRFYRSNTTNTSSVTGRLYSVTSATTGTLVGSTPATLQPAATGWVTIPLNAVTRLDPGVRYRVTVLGRGYATTATNYWTTGPGSGGITSGPFVVPASGDTTGNNGQGVFTPANSAAFPASTSTTGQNWWVDVSATDVNPDAVSYSGASSLAATAAASSNATSAPGILPVTLAATAAISTATTLTPPVTPSTLAATATQSSAAGLRAAAVSTLAATATTSLTPYLTETASISLPATAAFSPSGLRNTSGISTLAATATQSTAASVTQTVLQTLLATADLSSVARQTVQGYTTQFNAPASIFGAPGVVGASALNAPGSVIATVSAVGSTLTIPTLAATAYVSSDANIQPSVYATLAASATIAPTARATRKAATTLAATATVSPSGYGDNTATVPTLAATASLVADGERQAPGGNVFLNATAAVQGAAVRRTSTLATLAGTASLDIRLEPANLMLSATLAASAYFTANAPAQGQAAKTTLAATAKVFTNSIFAGTGTLAAVAYLTGTIKVGKAAQSTLSATASLSPTAYRTIPNFGTSTLAATANAVTQASNGYVVGVEATLASQPARLSADAFTYTPPRVYPPGQIYNDSLIPTMNLYVCETMTGKLLWQLPYSSLTWDNKLNGTGTMSATIMIESVLEDMESQGLSDPLRYFREFLNGPFKYSLAVTYGYTVLWSGVYLPSSDPTGSPTIQLGAATITRILDKRILINPGSETAATVDRDVTFAATEPRDLAWKIIQNAKAGAFNRILPIYCFDPPPSSAITTLNAADAIKTYYSYDLVTVSKALQDITQADNGPDIRFDPYLTKDIYGDVAVWYDVKIGKPYLEYAPAAIWEDRDLRGLTREVDAVGLATTIYVPGTGTERERSIGQAKCDYLTKLNFPALESIASDNSSEEDSYLLNSLASSTVRDSQLPTQSWSISVARDGTPSPIGQQVGDRVMINVTNHLTIPHGLYSKRIVGMSGSEKDEITLELDDDIVGDLDASTPVISGTYDPYWATRWGSREVLQGSATTSPVLWTCSTPVLNSGKQFSQYLGNTLSFYLPPDGQNIDADPSSLPYDSPTDQSVRNEVNIPLGKIGQSNQVTCIGLSFTSFSASPSNFPVRLLLLANQDGYLRGSLFYDANGRLFYEARRDSETVGTVQTIYSPFNLVQPFQRCDLALSVFFSETSSFVELEYNGQQVIPRTMLNMPNRLSTDLMTLQIGASRTAADTQPSVRVEYGGWCLDSNKDVVSRYVQGL